MKPRNVKVCEFWLIQWNHKMSKSVNFEHFLWNHEISNLANFGIVQQNHEKTKFINFDHFLWNHEMSKSMNENSWIKAVSMIPWNFKCYEVWKPWTVYFNEIKKFQTLWIRGFSETMKSQNSWIRAITLNSWNFYVLWLFQWNHYMTSFVNFGHFL